MHGLKITVSVEVRIVNPFSFYCNLSAFTSQFQRLHIWALCNFFGQEDHHRPPSPNVPMLMLVYGHLATRKTRHQWTRHQGSSLIALVTLVRAIIALTSTTLVWHGVYGQNIQHLCVRFEGRACKKKNKPFYSVSF